MTSGQIKEIGEKGKQLDGQGKARLFVALGNKDKINARKLIDLIMSRVSIKSQHIRDIHIMEKFSFITVPFDKAEKIVVSFKGKGQKPMISHAKKNGEKKMLRSRSG